MSFFSKNNKKDNEINMAKVILNTLGYERKEYSSNLEIGKYYFDHIYEDNYFKIVKPDKNKRENTDIYVLFNGQKVLDDNTYIPGIWEELFIRLYQEIETKINAKKEESLLMVKENNIIELLSELSIEKSIEIEGNIRIEKYSDYSGFYYEHYNGTTYRIYYNDKLVFYTFKGRISDKCYIYTPGFWEEEIKKYVEELKKEKFESEIDNIKKLIKTKEQNK